VGVSPGSNLCFTVTHKVKPTSSESFLLMLDLKTGKVVQSIPCSERAFSTPQGPAFKFDDMLPNLKLTQDGKYLYISTKNLARYRIEQTDLIFEERHPSGISASALSGDGKQVALASSFEKGSQVTLFSALDFAEQGFRFTTAQPVLRLGVDPLNANFYTSIYGHLELYSKSGKQIGLAERALAGYLGEVRVSPQGDRFLALEEDGFHVFDLQPGRLQAE
jgi:hypothetical protein